MQTVTSWWRVTISSWMYSRGFYIRVERFHSHTFIAVGLWKYTVRIRVWG